MYEAEAFHLGTLESCSSDTVYGGPAQVPVVGSSHVASSSLYVDADGFGYQSWNSGTDDGMLHGSFLGESLAGSVKMEDYCSFRNGIGSCTNDPDFQLPSIELCYRTCIDRK